MIVEKVQEILESEMNPEDMLTDDEVIEVYNKEFKVRNHLVIAVHCLEEIMELIEAYNKFIKLYPDYKKFSQNTKERICLIEEIGDCEAVYTKLQMLFDKSIVWEDIEERMTSNVSELSEEEILKILFHEYSVFSKCVRGKDVDVETGLINFKACLELLKCRYFIPNVRLDKLRTVKVKLLEKALN